MDYKELIGNKKLSGICYHIRDDEDDGGIAFILDGITYYIGTDPHDGYRSMCTEMIIDNNIKVDYKFPEQDVIIDIAYECDDDEFLYILNPITLGIILRVGTDNSDSHYPSAIIEYYPDNLPVNIDMLQELLKKLN